MKTLKKFFTTIIALAILVAAEFSVAGNESPATLRLGWQVPWATQGQLVMALKHTNITSLVGNRLDYVGFTYGGPLNKAAIAGEVDLLLTADQPALVLLSRDPQFRIIARLMYNRVCVYVPFHSTINQLSELADKTIMGPIGSAAERVAFTAIAEAGVNVDQLRLGQLDMAQQSALLSRAVPENLWPGVDALFGFDPLPAVFTQEKKAKMLNCGKVVSVVMARKNVIEHRRSELEKFLKAFKMSWHFFSNQPEEMNLLFSKESGLNVNQAVLDVSASIEPNRWVKSIMEMRFEFDQSDLDVLNQANQFLLQKGIILKSVDINQFIDSSIVKDPNSAPTLSELQKIVLAKTN